MGLFKNDKDPCPICGNPTPRLLATEVEGEKICSDCAGKMSMGPKKLEKLTLEKLKVHLEDREVNKQLLADFKMTRSVEIGFKTFCFDDTNRMFYIKEFAKDNPPVFKYEEVKGFKFREWVNLTIGETMRRYNPNESFWGYSDLTGKNRGMRTVIDYSADMMVEHDSYLEMFKLDSREAAFRSMWANINGEEERKAEDGMPVDKARVIFELSNKWWGKYKADLLLPTMNTGIDEADAYRHYIRDYQIFLHKVREIAAIMQSIINSNK